MYEDELAQLDSPDPRRIDFTRVLVALQELSPQVRGRWFERLLVALLRRDGLEAWHDPGAARPRQTDATFRLGDAYYLVEAKWVGRRAQPQDLASVRDRVRRVPVGTGACFVAMEGFTSGVINDLREHREQEILLIDGNEVRSVALGYSFRKLIDEKRRRFHVDAEIWFKRDDIQKQSVVLPTSGKSLVVNGSPTHSVVARKGRTCDLHFAIDTLQLETYYPTVSVELESSAEDVQELARLISTLHARLRLDDEGSFAIHQTETSWLGFGAEAFIAELRNVERRYASLPAGEHLHHSESATFVSHFEGGLIAIATQQQVNVKELRLHRTYVEVTMNGIPLDLERLRAVADEVDGRELQLRVHPKNDEYRAAAWLERLPRVEPVGFVQSSRPALDERPFIEGIVVRNPFFAREAFLKQSLAGGRWAYDLAHTETLVCWLRSSHCVGDRVGHYRLQGFECEQIGHVSRVRVRADWDAIEQCERRHRGGRQKPCVGNKKGGRRRRRSMRRHR